MSDSKTAAATADAKSAPAATAPPQAGAVPKFDLVHLLSGSRKPATLINAKGEHVPVEAAIKDKVVALYFSASWCGPCRTFTPKFSAIYKELQAQKKPFEVVFVSSDKKSDDMVAYMKEEMPWLGVPFDDRDTFNTLNEQFDVDGIPHLAIFNTDGTIITNNGKLYLDAQGAAGFPWITPRVRTLDIAMDVINEKPCLFVMMEGPAATGAAAATAASTAAAAASTVSPSVREAVLRELAALGADPTNDGFGLVVATPAQKTTRWRGYTGIRTNPCVMITDIPNRAAGSPKFVDSAPFGVGAATNFLAKYRQSVSGGGTGPALTPFVKSADRPAGDLDAAHPGMTIVTTNSFNELVLNANKHVLLDVFAEWCGPCKQFAPHIHRVARAFQELKIADFVFASINNEENDVPKTYLPEPTIPNIKLFPKGNKTPTTQIKYDAKRTDVALLEWLHAKTGGSAFDLKATTELVTKWNNEAAAIVAAKLAADEAAFQKCLNDRVCTFKFTGEVFRQQKFWGCKTCNKPGLGACETCKVTCHAGHQLTEEDSGMFYCDCGSGGFVSCGTACKALPK